MFFQLRWPWAWEKMGHVVDGMRRNGVRAGMLQEDMFTQINNHPVYRWTPCSLMLENLEDDHKAQIAFQINS